MSRLLAIELVNVMSIAKARLEFDESNILSLCGYNDSGKSAVTRALEIIFYNAYPNDQVKFIKDGEDFLGIGLEFDDGVEINRYKYRNGNSVWEMRKAGKVVYTNRLDNGIAAMSDTPDVIVTYLGVIQDEYTDEKLNVRRNTDKLFLINTTGGDNYKILNSVLKSELLAEASKKLNEDKNVRQTELINLSNSLSTLRGELSNIKVADDVSLLSLEQSIEKLGLSKARTEYIDALRTKKEIIVDFRIYDELPVVDMSNFLAITSLFELRNQTEIVIPPEAPVIDYSRVFALSGIVTLRDSLNVGLPPEVGVVSMDRCSDILSVGKLFNEWWQVSTDFAAVHKEAEEATRELAKLAAEYQFKICSNCNTVVL